MHAILVDLLMAGADDQEVYEAASRLRAHLLELSVDDVAFPAGRAPAGAKGDGSLIGTLVVTLANSAVLVAVVQAVREWTTRGAGRQAKISDGDRSLEVTGLTAEQQRRIIDAMLLAMDAETTRRAAEALKDAAEAKPDALEAGQERDRRG
ncbi:hypothetical protein ABZT47_05045 [Sphaerisporangium sp. NPDC005289]|uniref:hypothetical protein n=1 Tax=Sphaerisporangium sp. NPDC005289 TaxID=3155247 RepID=UPI0033B1BB15